MHRPAALVLLLPMSACTAGFATARLVASGHSVAVAEEAGAEANAPYEYTLAVRHYEKAIEEHASSEYRACVDMAKLATMWAEQAKIVAEGGTRSIQGFERAGDDLSDTKDGAPLQEAPEQPQEPAQPRPPPPKKDDELDDEDFLDEKEDE
ncbi:MAG TPA: hypothetical protein PKA64_08375 [Myxococcota bacterium]|nr:hypothetical protein [Myxococcota bacterium]